MLLAARLSILTVAAVFFAPATLAQPAARPNEFTPGAIRRADDLPASRLRTQLGRLPAPARDRAVAWLSNAHFTTEDLKSLNADATGGIFYIDDFKVEPQAQQGAAADEPLVAAAAVPVSPFPAELVFHSRPGAPNVIYLNFTGETVSNTAWNDSIGRSSIPAVAFSTDADLSTFSDAERLAIRRIWQRVSEDYAAFNVDVTTERPATFTTRTAHAVITRNTDANGAANPADTSGGVAYLSVFATSSYSRYRPAWIYHNNLAGEESYIAEAVSHEIGHNLGLSHDGKSDGTDYYGGHGSGETSWGPLMGTGYNRNVSQWSKGDYYLANNTQDDLATIAGKLSYRTDDHGNATGSATSLVISSAGAIVSTTPETDPQNASPANKGVLERSSDADVFSFAAGTGPISLRVNPWIVPSGATRGGNVDLIAELYNASGKLLLTNNGTSSTAALIQTNLVEGIYYLMVKATGVGNPTNSNPSGYTAYASMGQYFISGTVVPSGVVIPPGAELLVTDIMEPGIGAKLFDVIYTDNVAINYFTIGNDDIQVTGPNGYTNSAVLVSVNPPSNGTPRIATYRINPPGNAWSESDDGAYTISLRSEAVADTEGAFVPAGELGSFQVAVPKAVYFASMDNNPGWNLEGLWQHGPPRYTGVGPAAAATGTNILGYNLSGNYENRLSPSYATTPPINCAGASSVTLRFQRFLRVRTGDTANIQISTNGTEWTDLWSSRGVLDDAWQVVQYTLPSWATGSSSLRLRWGMASGQAQNDIGWNIDDVALLVNGALDTTPPTALATVANLVSGGSPSHTFSVTYSDDTAVSLASLDAGDLIVLGPNGYSNTVEFAGVDIPSDGSPRTASYSIAAPNGLWQSADNGVYQIILQAAEVSDTANNTMAEATLASFSVAISESHQALIVEQPSINIAEGGEVAFTVRLAEQPSANVTVISKMVSGDADITVISGATNLFTPDSWNVPLPVTVKALADADAEAGAATIQCESEGLAPAIVIVTEQEVAAAPQITAISYSNGGSIVTASATPGVPHILEASSDLLSWLPVATNTPAGGTITFEAAASGPARFYRVTVR